MESTNKSFSYFTDSSGHYEITHSSGHLPLNINLNKKQRKKAWFPEILRVINWEPNYCSIDYIE